MTLLEVAQRWRAVIPIFHRDKKPEVKWGVFQKQIPSDQQLVSWFNHNTQHNIALVTGHWGITVIDFDTLDIYNEWLAYAKKFPFATSVSKRAYKVKTARGVHVYVRLPQATKSRPLLKPSGDPWHVDIKSRGGYVLIPPSVHPSGIEYEVMNPGIPEFIWALSDILPADMLIQPQHQPKQAVRPQIDDPWDYVMNLSAPSGKLVDDIKAKYRIEDLFAPGSLQKTGHHHCLTVCPLHDDHDPSMWVDTEQQIAGCYAGCTVKPLDVINLYGRIHDLSNTEAIYELARGL